MYAASAIFSVHGHITLMSSALTLHELHFAGNDLLKVPCQGMFTNMNTIPIRFLVKEKVLSIMEPGYENCVQLV